MMIGPLKALLLTAGVGGAAVLCPLCDRGPSLAAAQAGAVSAATPDTATARLHISGMTCGTCPVTARLALKRVPGVYTAVVTLEDSLGVVQYDPARVTPDEIAANLTKATGYGAKVLADPQAGTPRRRRDV
ncbi:MAG: heavy-metal-associated domain-containing protein [Gemmatimonadetes bacterium]|nr:heavy-metal-associated domain-containing protein [Gemmatimonadota bacterium]